jgi:hypothetical protein
MASLLNKTVADLTVAELLQLLQSHAASAVPSTSAATSVAKPKKEVSAGVVAWNELVTETWEEMKADAWSHPETGKPASRKDAMAEASKRKTEASPEAAAASAARRAKRDEHLAKKEASPARASVPAPAVPAVEKAKKVLSPEHKAKMLAGAAAAREAKKAASAPAPVAAAPPSPAPAASTEAEEEEEEEWIRKSISGKKHLWNPANNHCYRCEEDGSQGEWAGLYDPKKQKIDDSVAEPEDE